MEELQDLEILQKIKDGEVNAYRLLVEKYKQRIYYTAYSFVNIYDEAYEISQEAFVKAFENIGQFNKGSSFYTWIYRITVNLCKDYVKSKRWTTSVSLDNNVNIDYEAEKNYLREHQLKNPETELISKEMHKRINSSIESLPLEQKTALILTVFDGLSHKDIAEIERCSEKTISWRIFEARKKIKEELKDYLEVEQ